MRIFGWIYIIIFSIYAVLVIVEALTPGIAVTQIITGTMGILLIILSIVVFILACIGKLLPRKIFLFMSGYNLLTIIFGMVVGILLVVKVGAEKVMSEGSTQDLIRETFTWIGPVSWILNIVYLLLAIYGIMGYLKKTGTAEQTVSSD